MILQALDAYYHRKQRSSRPADRLPAFGLESKEIPFVIEIDTDGQVITVTDTRSIDGTKKTGARFTVPKGIKKTSGVAANLLWDTAEYVLGVDPRERPERVARQHAAFIERIEALPETARSSPAVAAVRAFLSRGRPPQLTESPCWQEVSEHNPLVTFRLHGEFDLVCQSPAVVATIDQGGDSVPDGLCLVSGEATQVARLHPSIKGVWGAQTSGANIVSFNLDAFNSYGKQQGSNAPMSSASAFAYTTALNHLLAKGSSQRMQVGDTSTVFWAAEEHALERAIPNLFGEPPKDDPDRSVKALRAIYEAVQSGKFAVGEGDTRFHVLGLAPNAARIAIRFWLTAPAMELAQRIQAHFEDIRVARGPYDPEHLSLFRLLTGVSVQRKADNIPPNLGGQVMRAVLEGTPYPAALLNLAVLRCRAEQHPTYARAAVIKACLNRHIRHHPLEREFTPMLDPTNPNIAYRLGRLFAVLEKIQEGANPNLNATIRDRYYGAASSTPVAVFTTLLRLKNHHVAKLHKGRQVQMERLLGEIMAEIDDFPAHLPLPEQGRFALGYYHQRQDLFKKTEPTAPQEDAR